MIAKKIKIFDSESIPRINPKDIVIAYRDLELKPLREYIQYFKEIKGKKYSCPLAALYANLVIKSTGITFEQFWMSYQDSPISRELRIAFKYSDDYLCGYIRGFDGLPLPEMIHQEYKLGYEDGKECYNKVRNI